MFQSYLILAYAYIFKTEIVIYNQRFGRIGSMGSRNNIHISVKKLAWYAGFNSEYIWEIIWLLSIKLEQM